MVATPRHKEFILYFTFVPSFYLLRLFFLRQFSTSSLVFRRRRSSFLRPRKEIEHRYTRTHVCSRLFPKVVTNQRHWRNARLNTNHVAPGFDWKPIGLSLSFSPPPPPSRSFSLSLGNVSEQSFTVAYSTAVHFDVFFSLWLFLRFGHAVIVRCSYVPLWLWFYGTAYKTILLLLVVHSQSMGIHFWLQ